MSFFKSFCLHINFLKHNIETLKLSHFRVAKLQNVLFCPSRFHSRPFSFLTFFPIFSFHTPFTFPLSSEPSVTHQNHDCVASFPSRHIFSIHLLWNPTTSHSLFVSSYVFPFLLHNIPLPIQDLLRPASTEPSHTHPDHHSNLNLLHSPRSTPGTLRAETTNHVPRLHPLRPLLAWPLSSKEPPPQPPLHRTGPQSSGHQHCMSGGLFWWSIASEQLSEMPRLKPQETVSLSSSLSLSFPHFLSDWWL